MSYAVKKENKITMIQIPNDEDGEWVELKQNNLVKYLPAPLQERFKKVLMKKQDINEFKKMTNMEKKQMVVLSNTLNKLNNSRNLEKSFYKSGAWETVAGLLELFAMIKEYGAEAILSIGKQMGKGKTPAEIGKMLKGARKKYEEKIGHEEDIKKLLNLHRDPEEGKASKKLFQPKEEYPFRFLAKDYIEKQMETVMGVEISDMKSETQQTKIMAIAQGRNLNIYFTEMAGQLTFKIEEKVNEGNGINTLLPETDYNNQTINMKDKIREVLN